MEEFEERQDGGGSSGGVIMAAVENRAKEVNISRHSNAYVYRNSQVASSCFPTINDASSSSSSPPSSSSAAAAACTYAKEC